MRRCRMSVALAAVLAALTLSATAQASGSQIGILDRFLPLLVFHPGEEFRPGTVRTFVEDSSLEAATSPTTWVVVDPTPSVNDLPDSSPPVWRLNQRDCFAGAPLGDLACYVAAGGSRGEPTIYARVVRQSNLIVLQYWLFYYDNLYRYPFLPLGAIWQSHEGDWEVVNVVLSKRREPLAVGYSQHCSGETRDWADTPRVEGRPQVYVALGSHANYFAPGLHEFDRACIPPGVVAFFQQAGLQLPADVTAEGPTAREASVVRITEKRPAWIRFPGFWGELEYFNAPPPIGTVQFGTSPVGPAFHAVWQAPLETLEGWR
jgi:hypothetical protein